MCYKNRTSLCVIDRTSRARRPPFNLMVCASIVVERPLKRLGLSCGDLTAYFFQQPVPIE